MSNLKLAMRSFIIFLILGWLYPAVTFAAEEKNALHGQSWTFGQSADRNAQLWKKGVSGAALSKARNKDVRQKNPPDTSASIDRALEQAEKMRTRGKFGFSMQQDSSQWTVAPESKTSRVDEKMSRESRHVFRAYAGVESGGDFNINIGPELILKDEEHSAESAISDQPDSALGLGMKFKYDF